MSMNLPEPSDISSFVALARDENTEAFLPIYTVDMTTTPTRVVGFIWFRPEKVYGVIYDRENREWKRLGVLQKTGPAFLEIKDEVFDTSVTVVGDDIERCRSLYYDLKQKTRDYYDVQVQREHLEASGELPEPDDIPACSHPQSKPAPAGEEPFTRNVCRQCGWLAGLGFDEETVDRATLLDPEAIRSRCTPDEIWECDGLTAMVSTEDAAVDWVDAALYLLGDDAAQEVATLTGYESDIFSGALFCEDGEVVGYATWNYTFSDRGAVALRHLYVRPEYRGAGLAAQIVECWWEQMDDDVFFVGDPNPAGQAVIEELGYYDQTHNGTPVARDTYVLPTIGFMLQSPL